MKRSMMRRDIAVPGLCEGGGATVSGFRFHDSGWEGKCEHCRQWLPLDVEFWPVYAVGVGMVRCRACRNDDMTARARRRRAALSPEQREAENALHRVERAGTPQAKRDRILERRREHYQENREAIRAYQKTRYAAMPPDELERSRQKHREYQRANRKSRAVRRVAA